jgi:1,4-alpha-glucan branching enzyme
MLGLGCRSGVLLEGRYREIFNSDSKYDGGSNMENGSNLILIEDCPWMNRPYSIPLTLPPLAAIVITSPEIRLFPGEASLLPIWNR